MDFYLHSFAFMACTGTLLPWYASILLDSKALLKIFVTDDNLLEHFQIQKIMLFGPSIEDKSCSTFEKCRIDRGTMYGIEGHMIRHITCCWNLENKGTRRDTYLCELQMIYVNVPMWTRKLQPYCLFQRKAFYAMRFTSNCKNTPLHFETKFLINLYK